MDKDRIITRLKLITAEARLLSDDVALTNEKEIWDRVNRLRTQVDRVLEEMNTK